MATVHVHDRRDDGLGDGFARRALATAWRATRERPRTDAAREQAMEEVAAAWRAADGDDALVAAMDRSLANYRAGARWQTLEDAPPVYACRGCGEVALAAPPAACPGCGTRPLTFHEVLPIHFLEPLAADALVDALAKTPVEVVRLCGAADDDGPNGGVWSSRDLVRHLIIAEEVFVDRAWRMLSTRTSRPSSRSRRRSPPPAKGRWRSSLPRSSLRASGRWPACAAWARKHRSGPVSTPSGDR